MDENISVSEFEIINMTKRSIQILTIILGIVFFPASVAKMFTFDAFAKTISNITYLPRELSLAAAFIVIFVEFIGSVALFKRYKLWLVSLVYCCLLGFFLYALLIASHRGIEINCNCFGILNFGLSNQKEFILDIALLNLFILLYFLTFPKKVAKNRSLKFQILKALVTAALIIYVEYGLVGTFSKMGSNITTIEPILASAKIQDSNVLVPQSKNRLLLLLSFADFNCPLCYDDLMQFCDSLQKCDIIYAEKRVLVVFRQDDFADPNNNERMNHWATINNLTFPMIVLPDTIFRQINFKKSSVVVIDKSDNIDFFGLFPLGTDQRNKVFQLLLREI